MIYYMRNHQRKHVVFKFDPRNLDLPAESSSKADELSLLVCLQKTNAPGVLDGGPNQAGRSTGMSTIDVLFSVTSSS